MENNLASLLRDFAQGASNSAATNLSMPVDAIAWLLRKGGVPVPSNPVGGSDWMAQKGLTPEPKNKLAGLFGDVAGFAAPLAAITKAPQIAKGLLQGGENLAKPSMLNKQQGAIVWHGSPHKFPPTQNNPLGEFDFTKIGTGEGAQAYGHGGYLGGARETGEFYRKSLTHSEDFVDGKSLDDTIPSHLLARALSNAEGSANPMAQVVENLELMSRPGGSPSIRKSANEALDLFNKGERPQLQRIKPEGYLYKVDLPDEHIAKMLDWEMPLSSQPKEIQDIARTAEIKTLPGSKETGIMNAWRDGRDVGVVATGGTLHHAMTNFGRTNPEAFAELLKNKGIPGIKYLDEGSRAAGASSQNFVVFPGNERLLKILERNGQKP